MKREGHLEALRRPRAARSAAGENPCLTPAIFGRSTYYERRLAEPVNCASFADLRLRPTAEGARPRDRSGAVKFIVSQAANTATFAIDGLIVPALSSGTMASPDMGGAK